MNASLDRHLRLVVKAMREGRVVPFLGAGANLCGRPPDAVWQAGSSFLPSGSELADHLSREFLDETEAERNLLRVSQYVEVLVGGDWLYDKLHGLFAGAYAPTPLHELLAGVPERLFRRADQPPRYQLIVTTNYDDALEQAFDRAGEPYHLVWYVAQPAEHEQGKFVHRPPGGKPVVVVRPRKYVDVSTEDCTVILKVHGAVDRAHPDSGQDSYVITEDDYIDYLTGETALAQLRCRSSSPGSSSAATSSSSATALPTGTSASSSTGSGASSGCRTSRGRFSAMPRASSTGASGRRSESRSSTIDLADYVGSLEELL